MPTRRMAIVVLVTVTVACIPRLAPTTGPACRPHFTALPVARGELVGRVLSLTTGCPVADAVVRLSGVRETTTDTAGTFRFSAVVPGAYQLRIHRVGFDAAAANVILPADRGLAISWPLADACCISEDVHVPAANRAWWKFW